MIFAGRRQFNGLNVNGLDAPLFANPGESEPLRVVSLDAWNEFLQRGEFNFWPFHRRETLRLEANFEPNARGRLTKHCIRTAAGYFFSRFRRLHSGTTPSQAR